MHIAQEVDDDDDNSNTVEQFPRIIIMYLYNAVNTNNTNYASPVHICSLLYHTISCYLTNMCIYTFRISIKINSFVKIICASFQIT